MSKRLAVDTNAVVDFLRSSRTAPSILDDESFEIFIPITAVGELYAGVFKSRQWEENHEKLSEVLGDWPILSPDAETARLYGQLRANEDRRTGAEAKPSRVNDLWIAAICIQHHLRLLTRDAALLRMPELRSISW